MENQRPNQPMPEPNPGMCGCDRDLFLRVWQRVMPEERADCPIVVERPEGMNELAVPAMQTMAVPMTEEQTAQPAPAVDDAGDDFPTRDDVSCLGSAAIVDQERLQDLIGQELVCWRTYQALARRGGQGSRTLSAMAGNCRRRAKRLSAALFLISGVRFWPAEQITVPMPRSYFGALREQFLTEQNRGEAYRAHAEESRDACLRALYLDLADECMEHAARIRMLLENS